MSMFPCMRALRIAPGPPFAGGTVFASWLARRASPDTVAGFVPIPAVSSVRALPLRMGRLDPAGRTPCLVLGGDPFREAG